MRSIESEGDTIDQAIDNALQVLQVERDRVDVEIVSDATRGLFGFGGKKALVRATVRPPLSARVVEDPGHGAPFEVPRETESGPLSGQVAQPPPRQPARRTTERHPSVPPSPRPSAPAGPIPPELEARCRTLTSQLLALVGVSCDVKVRPGLEAGEIVLEVTGDSGGLLIGRRGQTLDALEYIVNRMIGRSEDGATARIALDVEGYRERRCEYLRALARRLAEKAIESGRVVTLNPMSPRDRRIVHLALHDDQTVATRSQGEGHYRRMLILPANRPPREARPAGSAR